MRTWEWPLTSTNGISPSRFGVPKFHGKHAAPLPSIRNSPTWLMENPKSSLATQDLSSRQASKGESLPFSQPTPCSKHGFWGVWRDLPIFHVLMKSHHSKKWLGWNQNHFSTSPLSTPQKKVMKTRSPHVITTVVCYASPSTWNNGNQLLLALPLPSFLRKGTNDLNMMDDVIWHLEMVLSSLPSTSYRWCTPLKINMEPKTWGLGKCVSSSKRNISRFHVKFQGCTCYIRPQKWTSCLMKALRGIFSNDNLLVCCLKKT